MTHRAMSRVACLVVYVLLLAGCASRPIVSISPTPEHYAWWLRVAFQPRGDSLRGLPVRAVRAEWCAIDELSPEHFDGLDRDAAPSTARYAVRGPEVDGRATVAVLAVFRACGGETGTALLLLDPRRGGPPLAVEVVATPAHYAMLDRGPAGELHVVFCQECDHATGFTWDAASRRLVELPEPAELR